MSGERERGDGQGPGASAMSGSPVRKCLFPVAGYGTRFLPATKSMPKEMLPIVDKPLVHFGVEEALRAGMTEIAFVTGRGKQAITDYFDISYELEEEIRGTPKEERLGTVRDLLQEGRFTFTRQRKIQGLGHAVLAGGVLIGEEPFGVVLSDDLCLNEGAGVMAQLARVFDEHRCCVVAVEEINDPEVLQRFGVVDGREIAPGLLEVNAMVEKPAPGTAPSKLAILGRYLLTPDIFARLEKLSPGKNNEIQLTDALEQQAREERVLAWRIHGRRFDCGDVAGYVEATNFYYRKFYLGRD